MFYLMVDADSSDAFFDSDDDAAPKAFETEAEAIEQAKEFSATSLVLKAVARVSEKTTYKVDKIK